MGRDADLGGAGFDPQEYSITVKTVKIASFFLKNLTPHADSTVEKRIFRENKVE
jgi:hypothetical protein